MRHAVVLSAVLLSLPLFGQDEPLPPVLPRVQPVLVALAVEPVHAIETVSLEDAARANDYATFHSLYEQTQNAAYAPLHELWTHSINDPIGAFYGAEMYERFASLYPEFETYIDEYKIVDDHGNAFYPTSETRTFLLARAVEGRTIESPEPIRVASTKRKSGFSPPPVAAAPRVRMQKTEVIEPPVGLKPDLRSAPTPAPAAVAAQAQPAPVPVPVPVQARAPIAAASAVVIPKSGDMTARGILLIIIGLVGVGLLALILRAPGDTPPLTRQ
jgi:hypothetical protein